MEQPYPSVPMLAMIRDAKRLAKGELDPAIFHHKHSIRTPFATKLHMSGFIEYFKECIPVVMETKAFEAEGQMMTALAKQFGVELSELLMLHRILVRRWFDKKPAFRAYTRDMNEWEVYDLTEDVLKQRLITVHECGACRRVPTTTDATPLQECARCHMAAYCNETCQTKDWTFHKIYCKDLCKIKMET